MDSLLIPIPRYATSSTTALRVNTMSCRARLACTLTNTVEPVCGHQRLVVRAVTSKAVSFKSGNMKWILNYSTFRGNQGWIFVPKGSTNRSQWSGSGTSQIRSSQWLPTILRLPKWRWAPWPRLPSWRSLQWRNSKVWCSWKCSRMVKKKFKNWWTLAKVLKSFFSFLVLPLFSEDWYKDEKEKGRK